MAYDCEVVKRLQKMLQEQNGFEINFTNTGDTISVSKWGDSNRKSYIISICKGGENTYKSIGFIKENNIEEFKKFLEDNIGRKE